MAVLVLGWRTARRWRRGAAVLAVPLCLLSAALVLNLWVGYFPTVQSAWSQLTSGPLPDQTDQATVTAMAASRIRPPHGTVVPVAIPSDGSHFKHRGELVYLPPEWFATTPPPALPTVMMIGGQFNTPADWTRRATRSRPSTTSRPPTTARRRCWCSWTPAAPSTTTPSASTGSAATPPTTSPKMLCRS
ncbi:putative conserved membrane protein [Mycobacterium avium subsp. avium 2285 (R)]|nr:putative conserved membrane protein [Mycobacterium avium subsp. avium 2285 (R)]